MYRMGNGNIPPFTKEILFHICSVREMFSTCAQAIVMYIMMNIFLTFRSTTIMVFHKGKMYRMGNGNIPPFTKEIMLLIRSVREMFRTCAEAIVKTTAYIVGYRNTAMSKAPTRIRPQLWTTVGSNHVQTYQLEMHMSLTGHPLKMIRPMVMKWSTRKDYIQYVLYCLYVDNHRVCAHVLVWSCMMSHEDDTIFNTSYLYPQASCMWFVVASTHKWNFLAQDILARSKLKTHLRKKLFTLIKY